MTSTDRLEKLALSVLSGEVAKVVEGLDVLNEMFRKKVWLERGYSSFHRYCVERLRMSEDCAARRLHVAELLARYPKLLRPLLLERRVHISGMALLYAIVTDENAERLINEAAGKSRRDIDEMRAREKPKEDISTGMKRQPALDCEPLPQPAVAPAAAAPTPTPAPTSKNIPIEVRSPNRHAYRTMLSDETRDGYQRVQDLTGKNDEEIFADMVKVYEAELLKRKHAQVAKPQSKARPRQDAQDIPASVKRHVWKRDNGCCTHIGSDGKQCCTKRHLQYHHIISRHDGGKATNANITLRCRAHNLYQAKLELGAAYVTNAIAKKKRQPSTRTGADAPMLFTFTNEVREPRATYAPSSASKRRRGSVQWGSMTVHAAMKRSCETEASATPAWSRPSRRNATVSQ